jgi:hypothetical protein
MQRFLARTSFRVFMAAAIFTMLGASTWSPGLEDLAVCRFDTEAAREMMETYLRYARSPDRTPISEETEFAYTGEKGRSSALQPDRRRTMFGADVDGIFSLAMHGHGGILFYVRAEVDAIRKRLEQHGDLTFMARKFPRTSGEALMSEMKTFNSGIPIGRRWVDTKVVAGTIILPAPNEPDRLMVSCSFRYEDGHPGYQ